VINTEIAEQNEAHICIVSTDLRFVDIDEFAKEKVKCVNVETKEKTWFCVRYI